MFCFGIFRLARGLSVVCGAKILRLARYFLFILTDGPLLCLIFFFFNDTATTEIYTLSLHDALPILECAVHHAPKRAAMQESLMSSPLFDVDALAAEYTAKSPQEVLKLAFEHFDDLWLSFSGADDIVVLDMAWKLNPGLKVFTLDTGRLHPETYRFLEEVRKHYGIQLEVLSPDHQALEAYVREKGLFDFYENGHGECCGIRKIAPLRRKLATVEIGRAHV